MTKLNKGDKMKLFKAFAGALGIALLMIGISLALPAQTRPQTTTASQSDKQEADCTGAETEGRCADKPLICPEGSYLIDYDENGQPICKAEPTGCPYGDSIPMSECDKHAPQAQKSAVKKVKGTCSE